MKKINSIQTLRACAFLLILAFHCDFPVIRGSWGVSIFFVLSGFCLCINYLPRVESLPSSFTGCVRYAFSRVKKLYALHLFMLLFKILFLWGMPHTAKDFVSLFLNIFLLQSLIPDYSVYASYNGVSWFLSTYFIISIAAPALLRYTSDIKSQKKLATSAIITASLMILGALLSPFITKTLHFKSEMYFTYICPLYRLLDFSLGVFVGKYYLIKEKENYILTTKNSIIVAVLMVFFSVSATLLYPKLPIYVRDSLIFAPASVLAVYLCAFGSSDMQKVLTWKPLVWLGNISGFAFLIHNNMLEVIRFCLNIFEQKYGYTRNAPEIIFWILATLILTLIVTQLYLLAEKKVKSLLKARISA